MKKDTDKEVNMGQESYFDFQDESDGNLQSMEEFSDEEKEYQKFTNKISEAS
jgi:hypothetical protein